MLFCAAELLAHERCLFIVGPKAVCNLKLQDLLWYLDFWGAKGANAVDVVYFKGDEFLFLLLCWKCRNAICSIAVASCTHHLETADKRRLTQVARELMLAAVSAQEPTISWQP